MKSFRKNLVVVVVLGTLAMIGTLMNSHPAAAQQAGPVVSIGGPLPLPVTLSNSISGSVAASQSGTWSVGINNAVTSPVPVRDVDQSDRHAFQKLFSTPAIPSGSTSSQEVSINAPADKALVIEYVNGRCITIVGTSCGVELRAINNIATGVNLTMVRNPADIINTGSDAFVSNQATRIIVTPGHSFVVRTYRNTTTAAPGNFSSEGEVFISGHYTDCAGIDCSGMILF